MQNAINMHTEHWINCRTSPQTEGFSFIFYPFAKIGKAMNLKLCYKSYEYAEDHYSRLPQGVIA